MNETSKRRSKSPLTKYLNNYNCNSQIHACGVLHAFNYQIPNNMVHDERD